MKVLVTGANGFVGRAVCRALRLAGHDVTGAVRSIDRTTRHLVVSRLVEVGEVGPLTDWGEAITGMDAVVHLVSPSAASLTKGDEAAMCREVIVDGTRRLSGAAADAGVGRLVFMSSIKANGETSAGRAFDERTEPTPAGAYGHAKLAAEQAAVEIGSTGRTRVTVLRPPAVYGPGGRGNLYALIRLVRWLPTWSLPVGALSNRRSFIFVDNLASATRAAVEDEAPVHRLFLLRDDSAVSTTHLVELILNGLGRTPRPLLPIPGPAAPLLLTAMGGIGLVRRLYGDLDIDDGAIRDALSWRPPVTMADAIARTVAWIRDGEQCLDLAPTRAGLGQGLSS